MKHMIRLWLVSFVLILLAWCEVIPQSDIIVTWTVSTWDTMSGAMIESGNDTTTTRDTSPTPQFTTSLSWALAEQVIIISPAENALIDNPLIITGSAPGNWFFEWVAPVTIVNRNGLILWDWYISAIGEWMTTGMVDFSGLIVYNRDPITPYPYWWIILNRDNPSGMPENDAWIEIPILFE